MADLGAGAGSGCGALYRDVLNLTVPPRAKLTALSADATHLYIG